MFYNKQTFYMQHPPREGRTKLASMIDFLLFLLFIWFLTIATLEILFYKHGLPVFTVVVILALETALTAKLYFYKVKNLTRHKDIWFSAQKCRDNLKKVGLKHDFLIIVKELLESNTHVHDLKIIQTGDSHISMSGYINEQKVGVMCLNPQQEDDRIGYRQVKEFYNEIAQSGIDKGIVVSTAFFSDEAKRYVRRINGKVKIYLLDHYAMLRMAQKAGHPVFPNEKWREDRSTILTGMEMAMSIKENIITSRKKALFFALLGIVLIAVSALNSGFIATIYLVFGIINVFIGVSGYVLSLLRKEEYCFIQDL